MVTNGVACIRLSWNPRYHHYLYCIARFNQAVLSAHKNEGDEFRIAAQSPLLINRNWPMHNSIISDPISLTMKKPVRIYVPYGSAASLSQSLMDELGFLTLPSWI